MTNLFDWIEIEGEVERDITKRTTPSGIFIIESLDTHLLPIENQHIKTNAISNGRTARKAGVKT